MISSEQSEIVQVCDRAYVMREGRIAGELARNRADRGQHRAPGNAPMSAAAASLSALARIPGVAIVLAVLCAGFGLASPNFTHPTNIANILMQSTILLLLALPMTLIIMTEGLDLSMGAVLTLASIALAITVVSTGSIALGMAAALMVGLAFGLANGALIALLGIPPFIATLGTLGVAQGLSLVVTDGQSVVGIPRAIQAVYSGSIAGIPAPIVIAAAAYALVHVLLYHTRFGTYVFALGGNREALKLAGVPDRNADRRLCARRPDGGLCRAADDRAHERRASDRRRSAWSSTPSPRSRSAAPRSSAATAGCSARCSASSPSACCATASICSRCRRPRRSPASARSSSSRCSSTACGGRHEASRRHRRQFAPSPDVDASFYRLLAAALICAVLAVSSDAFLTTNNILNVLRQTALLFLMASGLTLVILTAGLDLSVGANVALSACLAASVIKATGSPLLGVATGIGCGAMIGLPTASW